MASKVLYVLGCESSGKTSLIRQIEAMSHGFFEMPPIKTFPTAGQSITHCDLRKSAEIGFPCFSDPKRKSNKIMSSSRDSDRCAGAEEVIEIRELGGSMEPNWEKFVQSSIQSEGRNRDVVTSGGKETGVHYALLYVFDAVAIHKLCESSIHFLRLTAYPGECKTWPALVVLHKCNAPNAISVRELGLFLGSALPSTAQIMEVDAWTGYGLGDALYWIQNIPL